MQPSSLSAGLPLTHVTGQYCNSASQSADMFLFLFALSGDVQARAAAASWPAQKPWINATEVEALQTQVCQALFLHGHGVSGECILWRAVVHQAPAVCISR